MDVVVLDMASLRFQWDDKHMRVTARTALDEAIAVIDVPPGTLDAEAALLACDAALDRARLSRPDRNDPRRRVKARVALYNPFSAQISVGALPTTKIFGNGEPLPLPKTGEPAVLVEAGEDSTLTVGATTLGLLTPTRAGLSRMVGAHAG